MPSLQVQVAAGVIYTPVAVDTVAYGSLGTDSHATMKQGLVLDPTTLTLIAPTTAGQSQNYLVQVSYSDLDTNNQVLAYFNSTNPTVPYVGPGNSGASQPTTRKGLCVVSLLPGTAATTGTQNTPTPSSGYTGLYLITLTYGQTTITNSQITTLATAPFITRRLGSSIPVTPTFVGLGISNDGASPNSVFDVAVGEATGQLTGNPLSLINMPLPSAFTKTLSNFAVGTGNGSLDTGTVASSHWYNIFLIYNPTSGLSDILTSLSATTPTLPSGYTYSTWIGSLLVLGTGYIMPASWIGDTMIYGTSISDASAVTAPTTPTMVSLTVPTGMKLTVNYRLGMQNGGGGTVAFLMQSPDEPIATVSGTTGVVSLQNAGGANTAGEFSTTTNTSGQIRFTSNLTGSLYSINTKGFTKKRGVQ